MTLSRFRETDSHEHAASSAIGHDSFDEYRLLNLTRPQSMVSDATGRYSVTLNDVGGPTSFSDERGTWRHRNGLWTRDGSSGTDFFAGTVGTTENGAIAIRNYESGVRTIVEADGTRRISIETAQGRRLELTINPAGVMTRHRDGDIEWTSADGNVWISPDRTRTWVGRLGIDQLGRYWEDRDSTKRITVDQSAELSRALEAQERMSQEWGIRFSQPGVMVNMYGVYHMSRPLRTDELQTLEAVLRRNRQMDVENLQFVFVVPGPETDSNTMWGSYSRRENYGRGQVRIMPLSPGSLGWRALEGTLEHELVHHEQYNLWGASEWGSANSSDSTGRLIADMGWRRDRVRQANILNGRDRREYQRVEGEWAPLVNGTPATTGRLSDQQMRARALIAPCTNYFNTPGEMHAEAMAMFRMSRAMLFHESRQLYELCRRLDQEQINQRLGTSDGNPRFIRAIDGRVVESTEENTNAVRNIEREWESGGHPPPAPGVGGRHLCGCCV